MSLEERLPSAGLDHDTTSLLYVDNLRAGFPTSGGLIRAVDGVSFRLNTGECLGIVGESGSGKSVLARSIMDLLPPESITSPDSRIFFKGSDLRSMPRSELRPYWGPQIAMVFQDPMTSLNPVKRIGVQIRESLQYHLRLSRKESVQRALELLGEVGIPDPKRRIDQYPHELSGGMRQRVTIAIAISCEPQLLIADEPTTALDVTVQRQILDLLTQLQVDRGMAMILISHDLAVVAGQTDRIAVMYSGRFVELMHAETLFRTVRHPYTEALLRSAPRMDSPGHTVLEAIAGQPPDLAVLPSGCKFSPRCRYSQSHCDEVEPDFVPQPSGSDHLVRCHFPVESSVS